MSRFMELNDNANIILSTLLSSQKLCKYLYYGVADPLSQPDIVDTKKAVLFNNILPTPNSPNVQDTAKSLITVVLDDFSLSRNSNAFKTSKVVFNVLCHIDLWLVSGGKIRPYSILNEIDELFNGQDLMGIGELEFDRCRWIGLNDKWQGYQLQYKTLEFN